MGYSAEWAEIFELRNRVRFRVFLLAAMLMLWLGLRSSAWASVHQYPEGADRVMYRSLQTLRDRTDQAWQLVLFKRLKAGQTESIHLRLVGFPGAVEFKHPAPLRISGSDRGWVAADSLAENSLFPANVGEYDVLQPLTEASTSRVLQLFLPTTAGDIELIVPSAVMQEWRQVAAFN
ncbi:MAG: DUF3122 domain-containing protein [Oscillatoriales cyanobacterium C42_A2020_001]|nr:DUF3122 domain-containing protein [Leptolyngbyaceae cyanobacterium C42_A2020_001]